MLLALSCTLLLGAASPSHTEAQLQLLTDLVQKQASENEQLSQRLEVLEQDRRSEQEQKADEEQASRARADSLASLLESLKSADAALERGLFEGELQVIDAEAALQGVANDATGTERVAAEEGLAALTRAREALSRRDFQEARRWVTTAYLRARQALMAASST
jgi:hypothetical protein